MDCRKTLLVALSLASTGLGCIGSTNLLKPKEDPPPEAAVTKEADLPRRTPKASTCVAIGNFRAKEAANPVATPVQRQLMNEQAERSYQQALNIDPRCGAAYLGLAEVYRAEGNDAKALETYQKGLKKLPKDASLWFALGMCHSRQKQWEPALKELQTAARLDPENHRYATTLGFALARAGRYSESIACFTPVVGKAQAHYKVAQMARHMKQTTLSKEHLRLALQEKPDLEEARKMLAQLEGGAPPHAVVQAGATSPAGGVQPARGQ
jgi:Tfp pilus assembly protein PilF